MSRSDAKHEDFRIMGLLGEGSFGKVYKAEYLPEPGKIVAIKILKPDRNINALRAVKKELSLHVRFKHPNIVEAFFYTMTEADTFIVMEVCGDTLEDYLRQVRYTQPLEAMHILKHVATGVRYIHRIGYAHRDIKPANIVKCGPIWKLLDFGFVRQRSDELTYPCCTPIYMAPEAISGKTYFGQPMDIWAMGLIFRHLLTGEEPHYGIRTMKVLKQAINGEHFIPTISPNIDDVIRRMLDKDPKTRINVEQLLTHPLFTSFTQYFIGVEIVDGVAQMIGIEVDRGQGTPFATTLVVKIVGCNVDRVYIASLVKEGKISYGEPFLNQQDASVFVTQASKYAGAMKIFAQYVDINGPPCEIK